MRTSVRRGTDKTGPMIARLEKSVDNFLTHRLGARLRRADSGYGCDTCHLAGSRGSPHAARTSTIGEGVSVGWRKPSTIDPKNRLMLRAFPSGGRGVEERQRRGLETSVTDHCSQHPPSRTSTGASGLEARRTRLAPRPSGEGRASVRKCAVVLLRAFPCHRSLFASPAEPNQHRCKRSRGSPHAARTSTIGGMEALDNRGMEALDHRSGGVGRDRGPPPDLGWTTAGGGRDACFGERGDPGEVAIEVGAVHLCAGE